MPADSTGSPVGRATKRTNATVYLLAIDEARSCPWSLDRLNAAEVGRAARFRREADRTRFVGGRLLLRRLLRDETGTADWPVIVGAHGRPHLESTGSRPAPDINLSHCTGLAAAALTMDGRIGIDVESLDRDVNAEGLAKRYFTADETRVIEQAPEGGRNETFLRVWTAKEAVMKAIGRGLLIPLTDVRVDIATGEIFFTGELRDESGDWRLELHRLERHALAIAIRASDGLAPASVTLRWIAPSVLE